MRLIKAMSLKVKILIFLVPSLVYIFFLSSIIISERYKAMGEALQVEYTANFFMKSAKLVNGLQIERRLSNGLISGQNTKDELVKQRTEVVDAAVEEIRKEMHLLRKIDSELFEKEILNLQDLRKYVDSSDAKGSKIARSYSDLIVNIFSIQRQRALAFDIDNLSTRLSSLIIFQMARENAGGLRQSVVGTLTSGNPPTSAQVSRVMETMTGVSMNVNSPAASLSPSGKIIIDEFIVSEEWKKVQAAVNEILAGHYGETLTITRDEFYNAIVICMNKLSSFVQTEIELVNTEAQITGKSYKKEFIFYISFSATVLIFILTLTYFIFREIIRSLTIIINQLSGNAKQVEDASEKVSVSSVSLSQAASEQAAALEETSASVSEISAMIQKNAESAEKTADVAQQSKESATKGQGVVSQMINAMHEINTSNNEIMESINESNHRIAEIIKVITAIGEKTKVINDIVFQTKLLSFNASVEAARAGELGKGFAVVAEEVGNLAEMSGNSSKEITEMLDKSIKTVEKIITDTNTRIENLIHSGKEKVSLANKITDRCADVLNEISDHVTKASLWSSDIARANQEQAQGIQEITMAMNQLDQVTQTNAATSEQAATASRQLSEQSKELLQAVLLLTQAVYGTEHNVRNTGH